MAGLNYEVGAVLHGDSYVTGMDFHESGDHLVVGTSTSVHLVDAKTAVERKKVFVKSHGLGKIKFTHHELCVLLSSEKQTNDIRYLSLYDNKYLRYFRGHSDIVTSLSMSPSDDSFLTSSVDRTVCYWNLNSSYPIGKLKLDNNAAFPYAAFDKSGVVFGIMCQNANNGTHYLKLYDARAIERGPFYNIAPSREQLAAALDKQSPNVSPDMLWTHFEFSADGKNILINTNTDAVLVCDSYQNIEPLAICSRRMDYFRGHHPPLAAAFSPDSRYVMQGAGDNSIQVCDIKTGEIKKTLSGHQAPVKVICCNPVYDMFASACFSTALWVNTGED
jgi:COMPASS component SWD2